LIYLDSSVLLAELLMENRRPPTTLWDEITASSRLLEYEVWNRIHGRGLAPSHADIARDLLSRVALFDLNVDVLSRALHPFPVHLRTLDSLHLATADYLRSEGQKITLASYDRRLIVAAAAVGIEATPL
jgi:predicted nucleic acid-binding protein